LSPAERASLERIVDAERQYRECLDDKQKLVLKAEIAAMRQRHVNLEFNEK